LYEEKKALIEQKVQELTKKAKLSKEPKIKISKRGALAGVNASRNILFINENLLAGWQKGEMNENDINAMLVHEFGHLIECAKHIFRKSDAQLTFYIMALVIPLIFYFGLQTPDPGVGPAVIVSIWFLFLPWTIRRIYVPRELSADTNAIAFSLINDQEFADAIANSVSTATDRYVGPGKILSILDGFLSHPFLNERLRNIGFEIRRPVGAKRIGKT